MSRGPARTPVSLACSECQARNYKTTRREPGSEGGPSEAGKGPPKPPPKPIELRKFCKQCKRHTVHRETK